MPLKIIGNKGAFFLHMAYDELNNPATGVASGVHWVHLHP